MKSDSNIAIINIMSRAEIPEDWRSVIQSSHQYPVPFKTVEVIQSIIRIWVRFLDVLCFKKCPFPIIPIKVFTVAPSNVM